ncbi:MAG: RNB domain-containing ribonuclease [Victivallis sp.]
MKKCRSSSITAKHRPTGRTGSKGAPAHARRNPEHAEIPQGGGRLHRTRPSRSPAYSAARPTTEILGMVSKMPRESEQLVEECMLAADSAVGTELGEKGIAGIYRVHPQPDRRIAENSPASWRTLSGSLRAT